MLRVCQRNVGSSKPKKPLQPMVITEELISFGVIIFVINELVELHIQDVSPIFI